MVCYPRIFGLKSAADMGSVRTIRHGRAKGTNAQYYLHCSRPLQSWIGALLYQHREIIWNGTRKTQVHPYYLFGLCLCLAAIDLAMKEGHMGTVCD